MIIIVIIFYAFALPGKFIVFLFVQEMGGERRLCGYASGGCEGLAQGGFGEAGVNGRSAIQNTKRLCSLAQLRRACPTSIRQIA